MVRCGVEVERGEYRMKMCSEVLWERGCEGLRLMQGSTLSLGVAHKVEDRGPKCAGWVAEACTS